MPNLNDDAEVRRLEAWQLERLTQDLGFSAEQADELVMAGVNWRDAEKVLAAAGGDHRAAYHFLL